jgi:predicted GIY-YIG superfamily endonuclease
MAGDKRFVYVLKNADRDPHYYVGLTSDVDARLADHNAAAVRTRPLADRGNLTSSFSSRMRNAPSASSAI